MVWEGLEAGAERLRNAAKDSVILHFLIADEEKGSVAIKEAETDSKIGFSKPVLLFMILLFPFCGYFAHPSLFFAGLCFVSLLFAWIELKKAHRNLRLDRLDFSVLALCFLMLVNDFFSVSGWDGNGILRVLYLLSAWFVFRPVVAQRGWRNRLIGCFLFSGSICSGIGILQYFSGKGEMKWLEMARFGMLGGRVCATFENPNFLAVYLLLVFGISLGSVFPLSRKRLLGWIPLALSSLCLIFTWTRGAWLGALAALAFFCLFYRASSLVLLALSPLAFLGGIPFLPAGIRARFGSIGNVAESSSRYRLQTWKGVLRMVGKHPWGIGSGEASFHRIYPAFAVSGTERVMHAHNIYLQMATEYGIAGLLAFLFFLALLFRRFFALLISMREGETRAALLGFGASMVALLTMGLFDHLWYQPTLLFLFVMAAAGMTAVDLKQEVL